MLRKTGGQLALGHQVKAETIPTLQSTRLTDHSSKMLVRNAAGSEY